MSPEQCRGAGKVDHRTDIYSVGCIAYNMLTGKPPFSYDGFGETFGAPERATAPLAALVSGVPSGRGDGARAAREVAGRAPQTMEAVAAEIDALRAELAAASGTGAPDLLALVPSRRLAARFRRWRAGRRAGARGRVATTPMPRTGRGCREAGGRHLGRDAAAAARGEPGLGRGQRHGRATETIAPLEGSRSRRGASTWREPAPSRRGLVVGWCSQASSGRARRVSAPAIGWLGHARPAARHRDDNRQELAARWSRPRSRRQRPRRGQARGRSPQAGAAPASPPRRRGVNSNAAGATGRRRAPARRWA
jgi:hypothetical protein